MDWVSWHGGYDDPGSELSRRLAVVRGWIRQVAADADRLRLVSACAGQGRDVVGALGDLPDRQRFRGRLVEWDPANVAAARRALRTAALSGIEAERADAGDTSAYHGAVPADLVLFCGVFGNVPDDDIRRTVGCLPMLCAPGATVIWTRHRRAPDRTPMIREWFQAAGFAEVDFVGPADANFGVGVHRLVAPPTPYRAGARLFRFSRGTSDRRQQTV
jgi:hypothetical protein